MTLLRTLLCFLALAVSATAQSEQLQFLIEPGAFHPGNFSTPAPDEAQRDTTRAKTREVQQAVQMGMASHAEQMEAEIAAQYADMRLSKENSALSNSESWPKKATNCSNSLPCKKKQPWHQPGEASQRE